MLQGFRTMFKSFILLTLLSKLAVSEGEPLHTLFDNFIAQADGNFPPGKSFEYVKRHGGVHLNLHDFEKLPIVKYDLDVIKNLPETFDARRKWPNCPSINEIRDQGQCGSCWAVGTVETITDRVCTFTNGTKQFHFSAEDLVACNIDEMGCYGGSPQSALEYWAEEGLVSGGNYNSHEGCKPYSFPTCANHMKNCTKYGSTPTCEHSCEEGYEIPYNKDKKRGKEPYRIMDEKNFMAELYTNGPFVACFMVYEDFANYTGGIYKHVSGKDISGHAVKILGWGVENGTKYWLAANSWGTDFGENGFFRILRGTNECFIEMLALAGEPLLEDY